MLLMLSVIAFTVTGCADPVVVTECVVGLPVAGFWSGLWHGLTLPWSFIGQLFSDNIAMWAVANSGGWYNFGFFLGISTIITVSSKTTYAKKGK